MLSGSGDVNSFTYPILHYSNSRCSPLLPFVLTLDCASASSPPMQDYRLCISPEDVRGPGPLECRGEEAVGLVLQLGACRNTGKLNCLFQGPRPKQAFKPCSVGAASLQGRFLLPLEFSFERFWTLKSLVWPFY